MSDVSEFRRWLQAYLPGADLRFQALPGCRGLELLLIAPGYAVHLLSQQQIERLSDDPPYWIFCWASGLALARAILDGEVLVKDKVVADFGCGSGVVAIAAKMAGARRVYACDIDTRCCRLAGLNAQHNGTEINVISALTDIAEPVDLVLAADVLYERKNLVFLDHMLDVCGDVLVADSRLKTMPDGRFVPVQTVYTPSFPDYGEAKENSRVCLYRAGGGAVAETAGH
ncbi:class I SAM-dependent methyltransferase [Ketobacter sp.]|uniref:class I SAM-dependent methyltransferase n=1 Tax=Ketobacter sp. TaxID=2083498 RepID=UPI0025C640CD|nr:50S ribosomal protein L11 methyltransferase [Ketobacter sp.]